MLPATPRRLLLDLQRKQAGDGTSKGGLRENASKSKRSKGDEGGRNDGKSRKRMTREEKNGRVFCASGVTLLILRSAAYVVLPSLTTPLM
jgi:hypothetical protein